MKFSNNEKIFSDMIKDGYYKITDTGNIFRVIGGKGYNRNNPNRKLQHEAKPAEKLLPNGYLQVRTLIDGVRHHCYSHRIIWYFYHGEIPNGLVINHINGNKADNKIENLEAITHSENKKHAAKVMGCSCGENNGMVKLKLNEVLEIRALNERGLKPEEIATMFNMSNHHIRDIIAKRAWKYA